MRKRLITLFLLCLLVLPACQNTGEGLEEDVNNNVDNVQEELNEDEG